MKDLLIYPSFSSPEVSRTLEEGVTQMHFSPSVWLLFGTEIKVSFVCSHATASQILMVHTLTLIMIDVLCYSLESYCCILRSLKTQMLNTCSQTCILTNGINVFLKYVLCPLPQKIDEL